MPKKYTQGLIRRQRRQLNNFLFWCFIIGLGIFILVYLYQLAKPYFTFIIVFAAIVVVLFLVIKILKFIRNRKLIGELHYDLKKALEAMDSTAKTYVDEEAANRELVTTLKVMGRKADYQFYLGHGRRADAKVENVLIEGKLAPKGEEVDRLIGQLQAYSQYPQYKTYVVFYGSTRKNYIKRIEDEILNRYQSKIFLTYLKNPRRLRA